MITVSIFDEAISTINPVATVENIDSYSHNIVANGGFDTASFSFSAPISDLWEWNKDRLGKRTQIRSERGELIWEGFIDSISIQAGGVSMDIGPMMEVANKVAVKYMTVDYAIVFLPSEAAITPYAEDEASQQRYYILEEIVTAGSDTSDALAEDLRDSYLAEFSQPALAQSVNVSGGSNPTATIQCLGWYHLLNAYYYDNNDALLVGEYDASDKVADVLDADPNGLFSSDNAMIEPNTIQVPVFEEGQAPALSVIKKIVNYGDDTNNRFLFAVYEDKVVEYRSIAITLPGAVDYIYDIATNELYDTQGAEVKPWLARPGRWMRVAGRLASTGVLSGSARDVDDMSFIESVQFSMPNTLNISGGRFRTIDQRIARLGIAGIQ